MCGQEHSDPRLYVPPPRRINSQIRPPDPRQIPSPLPPPNPGAPNPAGTCFPFQIHNRAKSHISGCTHTDQFARYATAHTPQAALRYPSHAAVPPPSCPDPSGPPPTGASASATHPPPRTGQSAPQARRARSAAAASQPVPTRKKNAQISTCPTKTNTRIKGKRRRAGPAQLTRAPDPTPPTQKEDSTHHVPEPEPALDLRARRLDARERLLAQVERHLLLHIHARRTGIAHARAAVDVRQRVEVHLREHAEARVHVRLERQRQRDVEQVVPRAPRVVPQQHVQRRHLKKRAQRARQRAHERVEHQQLARERRGPRLRLQKKTSSISAVRTETGAARGARGSSSGGGGWEPSPPRDDEMSAHPTRPKKRTQMRRAITRLRSAPPSDSPPPTRNISAENHGP